MTTSMLPPSSFVVSESAIMVAWGVGHDCYLEADDPKENIGAILIPKEVVLSDMVFP